MPSLDYFFFLLYRVLHSLLFEGRLKSLALETLQHVLPLMGNLIRKYPQTANDSDFVWSACCSEHRRTAMICRILFIWRTVYYFFPFRVPYFFHFQKVRNSTRVFSITYLLWVATGSLTQKNWYLGITWSWMETLEEVTSKKTALGWFQAARQPGRLFIFLILRETVCVTWTQKLDSLLIVF